MAECDFSTTQFHGVTQSR